MKNEKDFIIEKIISAKVYDSKTNELLWDIGEIDSLQFIPPKIESNWEDILEDRCPKFKVNSADFIEKFFDINKNF